VIDQEVPSKVSMRGRVGIARAPCKALTFTDSPTATQKVGEVHETPLRIACHGTGGFGVGVIDQEVPSNVSTGGTVTQKFEEVHATPYPPLYKGFGVGETLQLDEVPAVAVAGTRRIAKAVEERTKSTPPTAPPTLDRSQPGLPPNTLELCIASLLFNLTHA
jgi:hypothetical protein